MLTIPIYKEEDIYKYSDYDIAILMIKGLSPLGSIENYDDCISKLRSLGKEVVLGVNKILLPTDIDFAKAFVLNTRDYGLRYYISDFGFLNILTENSLEGLAIFNPETMICNKMDAMMYEDFNVDSIALSQEITITDAIEIMNNTKSDYFYQVFGHRLMFYSLRSLITLYGNKIDKEIPKTNVFLKEETRDDMYPIVENENGTFIYRSYLISHLEELMSLRLKYHYIETLFVDSNIINSVLKAFRDKLNGIDVSLDGLDLNIMDGFKFKDSVYQKGELK